MSHMILCDSCGEIVCPCELDDCEENKDHYDGEECDLCMEENFAEEDEAEDEAERKEKP